MKVKTLSIATALLLAACTPHQNPGACTGTMVKNCNPTVYFDFNSAELRPQTRKGLDWVSTKLSKRTNSKVAVVGYADLVGEDGINMEISKQRAKEVRDYLVARGIPKDKMVVAYNGNRLASSNPNLQDRERRVEIVFLKKDKSWYDNAYSYITQYKCLFE